MTNKKQNTGPPGTFPADTPDTAQLSSPYIEVDLKEFLHFLEDTHLTEEEKLECLQVHWRIICDLMSLGFGIHPVQQVQEPCGKDAEPLTQPTFEIPRMLELGHQEIIKTFGRSADAETGEGVEK